MWEYAPARRALVFLLVALCALGPVVHDAGFSRPHLGSATAAPMPLTEQVHEKVMKLSSPAPGTRAEQKVRALDEGTSRTWLYGAALQRALSLRAACGGLSPRAPDNPGWQLLLAIGINRR
ncbi:hypothetical protein HBE99_00870 [Mycobacteroides chelonae]|uniref:hypothetical protein n=1 Tax=Mycobacteroides chelonae TaxID=1774 RepID=UPI0019103BEF|nr:hypothetical protein [Mycobacteroides chelonae]QQG95602.1 hypothetical protein HBE99_00870 [Mycobacteroides chelonae]